MRLVPRRPHSLCRTTSVGMLTPFGVIRRRRRAAMTGPLRLCGTFSEPDICGEGTRSTRCFRIQSDPVLSEVTNFSGGVARGLTWPRPATTQNR